ncbi:hypothetical protein D3C86_1898220 [compost metagenome]
MEGIVKLIMAMSKASTKVPIDASINIIFLLVLISFKLPAKLKLLGQIIKLFIKFGTTPHNQNKKKNIYTLNINIEPNKRTNGKLYT